MSQAAISLSQLVSWIIYISIISLFINFCMFCYFLVNLIEVSRRGNINFWDKFYFISSTINLSFLIFFTIQSSYYSLDYTFVIFLSSIVIGIILSLFICFLKMKKSFYRYKKYNMIDYILTSVVLLTFLVPLVSGVLYPLEDPVVTLSPSKKYIKFPEIYNIEESEKIELWIFAKKGYAWDINISFQTNDLFYIWIDNELTFFKSIKHMENGETISWTIKIQRKTVIDNGTYPLSIICFYKSVLGTSYQTSDGISVIIGEIFYLELWVLLVGVIISIGVALGISFIMIKRRHEK